MSTGDGLSVCPACGKSYYIQVGHNCNGEDKYQRLTMFGYGDIALLSKQVADLRASLATAQAENGRLREVVKKLAAYGEIWDCEGTVSEDEAELIGLARAALKDSHD